MSSRVPVATRRKYLTVPVHDSSMFLSVSSFYDLPRLKRATVQLPKRVGRFKCFTKRGTPCCTMGHLEAINRDRLSRGLKLLPHVQDSMSVTDANDGYRGSERKRRIEEALEKSNIKVEWV